MADTVDDELHAQVKSIVDDLEAAASGSLYEVDGDWKIIDDIDEWKAAEYEKKAGEFRREHHPEDFEEDKDENGGEYESYEEWMEDEIGTADDVDEPDEVPVFEYLDKQSLGDVRFEVDSSMELHGGKVLFCFGGPNVWVADDEVRGYWGSSRVEMSLDSATRSALWSWFEEQWDMARGR